MTGIILDKDMPRPPRCADTNKLVWSNVANSKISVYYQRPPPSGQDYSRWRGVPEIGRKAFPCQEERFQTGKEDRLDATKEPGRSIEIAGWHSELDPQNIWTVLTRFCKAHKIPIQCIKPELTSRGQVFVTITFSNMDYTITALALLRNWVSMPRLAENFTHLSFELPAGALHVRRAASQKRVRAPDYSREERGRARYS